MQRRTNVPRWLSWLFKLVAFVALYMIIGSFVVKNPVIGVAGVLVLLIAAKMVYGR
jgi:hypothetical protein